MNVGVIGAGPAGITAAYELVKRGVPVEVFEADFVAGGMAKSISLWGRRVDLGPHRFFSNDRRINELWLEVVGKDYEIVDRLTRILYKQKFYAYPLKPLNAFGNLGLLESARCMLSYGLGVMAPIAQDGSFENWVVSRFGRRLFEIFFKTYSEKLWGLSCGQLDSDFAAQRIKKLSLFEALRSAFLGNSGNKHKTLVDQFAYPIGGTGMVYERMAEYVNSHGGKVNYRTPIQKLCIDNGRVTGVCLEGNHQKKFDHVISSMPLTKLIKSMQNTPPEIISAAEQLKFRNTILVYLHIDSANLFPDQWIYVHSPELKTGRITNFKNWVSESECADTTSIIVLEYWCNDDEILWNQSDANLIALAKREIKLIGLKAIRYLDADGTKLAKQGIADEGFQEKLISGAKSFNVLNGYVHRVKRCYPVYGRGYKQYLKPIEAYLCKIPGLTVIGRYGAFKYNNQDHSILMGLLAAQNIADGAANDLWQINTDYDVYQEATVITKTGLKPLLL